MTGEVVISNHQSGTYSLGKALQIVLYQGRAEIGYWIAESGRGQGGASEAVAALSDWAFEHLDVDRLSLFIEPWNTASIKTAERGGYYREGLLRNWERVGGSPRDMWSYAQKRSGQTG